MKKGVASVGSLVAKGRDGGLRASCGRAGGSTRTAISAATSGGPPAKVQ